MANSRQRRTQRRAKEQSTRERLWFIAEHPLLASGAGAMLLTGIATEVSGWPWLAALFYLAAILLLIVVFIRADLFRVNPKRAWGILSLSTVLVIVLWVAVRPEAPLSASELAKEIAKELPINRSADTPPVPSPSPTQSPSSTQSPIPSPAASVRLPEMVPQSPTPTPIQSLVYARFLGGDKNPLGRRKVFKAYYPQIRSEIEFEAHFSVRYADNRPRLEVYNKQPTNVGVPAFYYAIEHYSEIKRALMEESGFTALETSGLITIYPDFVVSLDLLRHMSGHASKHGLLLQVVWFEQTGKPPGLNPFEP